MLSICIATRNRADLLARHLDHISRFRSLDYEVVVSNNASSDHTEQVIDRFRSILPRLHSVTQVDALDGRQSVAGALAGAAGDHMMFVADDDFLQEPGLLAATSLLDSRAEVAAVYGGWAPYDLARDTVGKIEQRTSKVKLFRRKDAWNIFREQWWMELPIFRRSAYLRSQLPLPFGFPLDYAALAGFLRHGNVAMIPEVVVHVTQHPGQESRTVYRDEVIHAHVADLELFAAEVFEADAKAHAIDGKIAGQYAWAAKRAAEDGELLLARHLYVRAIGRGSRAAAKEARRFEQERALEMAGEMLSQLHRLSRPTSALVAESLPSCGRAVREFARRHADVKLVWASADEIVARPDDATELLLCGSSETLERRERALGHSLRKARALPDLLQACSLHL